MRRQGNHGWRDSLTQLIVVDYDLHLLEGLRVELRLEVSVLRYLLTILSVPLLLLSLDDLLHLTPVFGIHMLMLVLESQELVFKHLFFFLLILLLLLLVLHHERAYDLLVSKNMLLQELQPTLALDLHLLLILKE